MATFFTPPGFSGTAELTASNGLGIEEQGLWRFSLAGFNDGATFGLSLTHPAPLSGGELRLAAQAWPIAVVGNTLTDYVGPDSTFYPASQCRIEITGAWRVLRQQNSNSFNGIGVIYSGVTETDLGDRAQGPALLTLITQPATYVIQGADVTGGAQDTFSDRVFRCRCTETATSDNSNRVFQSNTVTRPTWVYSYSKSWQITPA